MVKVNPKHAKNPKEGQLFDMEKIARLSHQIATIRKRHEERVNRDNNKSYRNKAGQEL